MTTFKWQCLECGHTFKTLRAAERAFEDGCPNCGGVDIDLMPVEDQRAPRRSTCDFDAVKFMPEYEPEDYAE